MRVERAVISEILGTDSKDYTDKEKLFLLGNYILEVQKYLQANISKLPHDLQNIVKLRGYIDFEDKVKALEILQNAEDKYSIVLQEAIDNMDTFTTADLFNITEAPIDTIRALIRKMTSEGRLECVAPAIGRFCGVYKKRNKQ